MAAAPSVWPREGPFVVHKFGGTSVGTPDAIKQVVAIVEEALAAPGDNVAVVVSAMGGKPKVTDMLLDLVTLAAAGNTAEYTTRLSQIEQKHMEAIEALLPPACWEDLRREITKDFDGLRDLLRAVVVMKANDERTREIVSGHGEVWSAKLITALLQSRGHNFHFLDARKVITVKITEVGDGREIQWETSQANLAAQMAAAPPGCHVVATGFIASTTEGVMTTLRRDGSDYSASIFGRLLMAREVTIWTDVSGVFSADPRMVPEARVVPYVSYDEAMELAYFGAKVIHPKTMTPVIKHGIPIYIKNTFAPKDGGTCIGAGGWGRSSGRSGACSPTSSVPVEDTVRGLSNIDNLALFNLEGSGLVGVVGAASKLFACLHRAAVNVVMIAQASSEHSICFAVPSSQAEETRAAVAEAFFREIHVGEVNPIAFTSPVSIIAAVGDNMHSASGVSGRFFNALGRANINVLAISQGSSERNISAVVDTKQAARALRAVHSAFLMTGHVVSMGIVGASGSDFAAMKHFAQYLHSQSAKLWDRFRVRIIVGGVCDSERMVLSELGIDIGAANLPELLQSTKSAPFNADAFGAHIRAAHISHWVVVDCNVVNDPVASKYPGWLDAGIHILSSNLSGASGSRDLYAGIQSVVEDGLRFTSYTDEACIAPGVPVMRTLDDVLKTGDSIVRIEAMLNPGINVAIDRTRTASFDDPAPGTVFSTAIARGDDEGVFSGSVEDNLTGHIDARRAVVLARKAGFKSVDISQVHVESLLKLSSSDREEESKDESSGSLGAVDEAIAARVRAASERGNILRYMITVEADGSARVGLEELGSGHPFYHTKADADGIALFTETHEEAPVVLQAPTPSPALRASSLFGDLMRLANSLGARPVNAPAR